MDIEEKFYPTVKLAYEKSYPALIEELARALCVNAAVDPDQVGGSWDGGSLPKNEPAWTEWVGDAESAFKLLYEHMIRVPQ